MSLPETVGSIHIAAAGKSSRMRPAIEALGHGENFPKHLLPTGAPGGETLLGRIIRQSRVVPTTDGTYVYTNRENKSYIQNRIETAPDHDVSFIASDNTIDNFFIPFMQELLIRRHRLVAGSGDHYMDDSFDWRDLVANHNAHDYPITFLSARSIPVSRGAVFTVQSDQITSFDRPPLTTPEDRINIGLYVFDPTKEVLAIGRRILEARSAFDADDTAGLLISEGLVGTYTPDSVAYNVNNPETYDALLRHTAQTSV
jgi:NDP-sugar pyrophosphorylase family protein